MVSDQLAPIPPCLQTPRTTSCEGVNLTRFPATSFFLFACFHSRTWEEFKDGPDGTEKNYQGNCVILKPRLTSERRPRSSSLMVSSGIYFSISNLFYYYLLTKQTWVGVLLSRRRVQLSPRACSPLPPSHLPAGVLSQSWLLPCSLIFPGLFITVLC